MPETTTSQQPAERGDHTIHLRVDDEHLTINQHVLTPNQLMTLAGIDPTTHFLTLIHGHEQTSYKDRGDEPIELRNGQHFVSASTGPTPVS